MAPVEIGGFAAKPDGIALVGTQEVVGYGRVRFFGPAWTNFSCDPVRFFKITNVGHFIYLIALLPQDANTYQH